jgi:serine/threonine protein kinase
MHDHLNNIDQKKEQTANALRIKESGYIQYTQAKRALENLKNAIEITPELQQDRKNILDGLKGLQESSDTVTACSNDIRGDLEITLVLLDQLKSYNINQDNINYEDWKTNQLLKCAEFVSKEIPLSFTWKQILDKEHEGGIDEWLSNSFEAMHIEFEYFANLKPPLQMMKIQLEEHALQLKNDLKGILKAEFMFKEIAFLSENWTQEENESISLEYLGQLEDEIIDAELQLAANKRRVLKTFKNESEAELKKKIQVKSLEFQKEYHRLARLSLSSFPELIRVLKNISKDCLYVGRRISQYEQSEETMGNTAGRRAILRATFEGEQCVLKQFNFQIANEESKFYTEVKHITRLNHPNIVQILAAFTDLNFGYIHMPFYQKGSLNDYLNANCNLRDSEKRSIASEILSGLSYIHGFGLLHCDLKLDNILIDDNNKPLIGDFDVSREDSIFVASTFTVVVQGNVAGTLAYMSPDQKSSIKSDIYSYGLIVFDMHFFPLKGNYQRPLIQEIIANRSNVKIPENQIQGLAPFLSSLLLFDPSKRPDTSHAMFDPYFTTPLIEEHDSSEPKYNCIVCFDSFWADQGISCSADIDPIHFSCSDCFHGYLDCCANQELAIWSKRNNQIQCLQQFCDRPIQSNKYLKFINPETYEKLQSKMIQINEQLVATNLENIFQKRLKIMENQSAAQFHFTRITEDILNLCCPSCKAVFIDFEGCFALTCKRCSCGFCAWCLQDCGRDAHNHVARCPKRLTQGVFGTIELFQRCHANRKRGMIEKYFKEVIRDPGVINEVKIRLDKI